MIEGNGSPHKLFAFWRASAVYRVRVALAIKKIAVPEHFVDLDNGGQRDPDFLAINPMGAVPALMIKGSERPLTQSLAILEYLDEIVPEPALLPSDALGRARVRSLALTLAADTHPFIVPRVRGYLMSEHGFSAEQWRDWLRHWLHTGLGAFESRLIQDPETGAFCHGDEVTTADLCLCSIVMMTRILKLQASDTPRIDAIVARCETIEAFGIASPHRQEGAPSLV